MNEVSQLFDNNRAWAARMTAHDPGFFQKLSLQQKPKYLWIGCADSRVPANEIVGLLPGELFVHRNVSNVVAQDDPNCLSVIQYAVDVLQVRHIIVCGHYGCGGVEAALEGHTTGLIHGWLGHVRHVRERHQDRLAGLKRVMLLNRLAEQAMHVAETYIVRDAWARQQRISIHGWIYAIEDGLLRDLGLSITKSSEAPLQHEAIVKRLAAGNGR
jgi:carbonic anhydrase